MSQPSPAIMQAIAKWADAQRQPVYLLRNIKAQRSRHQRWAELVKVARGAKPGVTDGEIIAAIEAVLAERTSALPVLVLEV